MRADGLGVAAILEGARFGPVSARAASPVPAAKTMVGSVQDGLSVDVIELFEALPGTNALASGRSDSTAWKGVNVSPGADWL